MSDHSLNFIGGEQVEQASVNYDERFLAPNRHSVSIRSGILFDVELRDVEIEDFAGFHQGGVEVRKLFGADLDAGGDIFKIEKLFCGAAEEGPYNQV